MKRSAQNPILPPKVIHRTADPANGTQTALIVTSMTDLSPLDLSVAEDAQVTPDKSITPQTGGTTIDEQVPTLGSHDTQQTVPCRKDFNEAHLTDERESSQHKRREPADQTISEKEMQSESFETFANKTLLKKEWECIVCEECINAKHLVKHLEFSQNGYKGRSGLVCTKIDCRQWVSSLWQAKFERSQGCCHRGNSNTATPPGDSTSRLADHLSSQKSHRRQTKANPRPSESKVSKVKLPAPARNEKGKFVKRARGQSNTSVASGIAGLTKSSTTQDRQAMVSEQRQARVPGPVMVTNGNVTQRFESFNQDILHTYQGKHVGENMVEKRWASIAKKISDFDLFIRGIALSKALRDRLRFLDDITPFSDLQEIGKESESPEEYDDPSRLLLLLKGMFKVPLYTSLDSAIDDQIRQLKFSHVLQATLAYLIHLKIFSAQGRRCERQEIEKHLVNICGEQQGAALAQYVCLGAGQSDHFKRSLKHRAGKFARSIYITLLPFCQWAEGSPNNNPEKQIELLTKLALDCLSLATDLHSREGTFSLIWPEYGSRFDPELHCVDSSQSDAVSRIADEAMKRQVVAFVLMPAVQRVLPYEEEVLPYARGVVLLREPFVE